MPPTLLQAFLNEWGGSIYDIPQKMCLAKVIILKSVLCRLLLTGIMKKKKTITDKIFDRRTKEYKRWIIGCLYSAEANCYPSLISKKDFTESKPSKSGSSLLS